MINLNIGEIKYMENSNEEFWTVLGSCVTVILHGPNGRATMCHAQMPGPGDFKNICADSCPKPCYNFLPDSNKFKFVNCAVEYMVKTLSNKGVLSNSLEASLIGGSSVIQVEGAISQIGKLNVKAAKEALNRQNIKLVRQMTGGKRGINIWYRADRDRLLCRYHGDMDKIELTPGMIIEN